MNNYLNPNPVYSSANVTGSSAAGYAQNSSGTQQTSTVAPATKVLTYMAAVFVLLLIIKYASEHERSGFNPAFLGVGFYNLVTVTLMAVLGLSASKVILNKYYVPGLTELVTLS